MFKKKKGDLFQRSRTSGIGNSRTRYLARNHWNKKERGSIKGFCSKGVRPGDKEGPRKNGKKRPTKALKPEKCGSLYSCLCQKWEKRDEEENRSPVPRKAGGAAGAQVQIGWKIHRAHYKAGEGSVSGALGGRRGKKTKRKQKKKEKSLRQKGIPE